MYRNLCLVLTVLLLCQTGNAQNAAMKNVDKDSDGKVSVKEFTEYAESRLQGFDEMDAFVKKVDADGNGEISEAEFDSRREVLQSMMNGGGDSDVKPHVVGDKASDFELQSVGKKIKLSDRFAGDGKPVVVVFSRANW